MDIAFDIEVHFYTKFITFLSDLWSLFCIIWLFNGLSVPGGSIWTSSWGYWSIPINSEFNVDLLLDIQQKLITNKEKKIHLFCSERIPKIIFYFEEFAEKNIWQHAYFVKGIEPPPRHLPPISTVRSWKVILSSYENITTFCLLF